MYVVLIIIGATTLFGGVDSAEFKCDKSDYGKCFKLLGPETNQPLDTSDEERLDVLCPYRETFMNCLRPIIQTCGIETLPLITLYSEDGFEGLVNVTKDLCENGTTFRNNFLASNICMNQIETIVAGEQCEFEATELREKLLEKINEDYVEVNETEEDYTVEADETLCAKVLHKNSCYINALEATCVPEATAMYKEYIHKLRFTIDTCPEDAIKKLKSYGINTDEYNVSLF